MRKVLAFLLSVPLLAVFLLFTVMSFIVVSPIFLVVGSLMCGVVYLQDGIVVNPLKLTIGFCTMSLAMYAEMMQYQWFVRWHDKMMF